MKTLTTQQIEELKKLDWEKVNDFFKAPIGSDFLTELTGYNIYEDTVTIMSPMSWQVYYYKSAVYQDFDEKYYLQYRIFVGGVQWASGNFAMFDGDLLGLYTPKEEPKAEPTEEKTDDEKFIDYLRSFVGERPDGDVIELIKQNLTDFWNNIATDVMENAEEYDLPDNLKEDVGRAWAEDNTDDIKEIFLRNATSDDLKDIATEIINDYL